jgi:hypothetical protein
MIAVAGFITPESYAENCLYVGGVHITTAWALQNASVSL